jgi:drug/metabolite transporter (DMT)-like permease
VTADADHARRRARRLARLGLVASAISFGLMALLARWLTLPRQGFSPGHLSVLRFVIGAGAVGAYFLVRPSQFRLGNMRLLILRGLSGGAVVVLYFYALSRIPAGQAGVVYNLFPVLATVLSLFIFKERPRVHLLLGILAASFGVGLVLSQGHLSIHLGAGEISAIAAAFFAALSANVIRASRATDNAATIFFFFCVAGLPVVLPFALSPWPRGLLPWMLAGVMSLLALLGQVLMAEAYGALTVAEAAVWLQLMPISQYLLAVPLLGESLTTFGVAGVLLTVAGVIYGTALGQRKPAPDTLEGA